jgi:hypothetical protein
VSTNFTTSAFSGIRGQESGIAAAGVLVAAHDARYSVGAQCAATDITDASDP